MKYVKNRTASVEGVYTESSVDEVFELAELDEFGVEFVIVIVWDISISKPELW